MYSTLRRSAPEDSPVRMPPNLPMALILSLIYPVFPVRLSLPTVLTIANRRTDTVRQDCFPVDLTKEVTKLSDLGGIQDESIQIQLEAKVFNPLMFSIDS